MQLRVFEKVPVGVSIEERLAGSDIQIDIYIYRRRLNYSSLDEGLDYSLIQDIGHKALNKENLLLEEIIQHLKRLRVLIDAKASQKYALYNTN